MFGIKQLTYPKKGIKIIENIYSFSELPNLDCNIYVLKRTISSENNYELLLIDAGNAINSNNLIEGMKNIGLDPTKITKIVVSHEHVDHILGIYNIPSLIKKFPQIYAFGRTTNIIKNGDESSIVPKGLGIELSTFDVKITKMTVWELKEGDTFNFGEFSFDVLYTPGHSLGSICLYEKNNRILFPGDVVFCGGSFGRFDFPGGSLKDLRQSIKRLMSFDVSILAPGHMNFSVNGNEEIKRANMILDNFY